ncbi:hypothetical protein, partial [Deinococcus saxicola]|uniref:hypothetical protein n=1 Tax=Deinococcus saxicola TaxID=249406 RepID=UPI0039EE4291
AEISGTPPARVKSGLGDVHPRRVTATLVASQTPALSVQGRLVGMSQRHPTFWLHQLNVNAAWVFA